MLLLWQYACCDELAQVHLSLLMNIGVAVVWLTGQSILMVCLLITLLSLSLHFVAAVRGGWMSGLCIKLL